MSELDTTARALAECALKQQAAGRLASAERLLQEARSLDPDEVASFLREHGGGLPALSELLIRQQAPLPA